MPYFKDSQDWLHQSTLLLSARPSTTRLTTKYRVSPPQFPRARKSTVTPIDATGTLSPPPQQPEPSRANLVLKTYDPASGACLKYKTDKAAEVGRLVAALGKCGRVMSGLSVNDEAQGDGQGGRGERDDTIDVDDGRVALGKLAEEAKPTAAGGAKDGGKGGAQGQKPGQGQAKGASGTKKKKGKK
ncbi:MAG: hypothetical protein LQ346_002770 [Caloplaca aetnensis]|nr:MAG: hypothetical protein LQ346_002770 [Caloplaca aetnensis]